MLPWGTSGFCLHTMDSSPLSFSHQLWEATKWLVTIRRTPLQGKRMTLGLVSCTGSSSHHLHSCYLPMPRVQVSRLHTACPLGSPFHGQGARHRTCKASTLLPHPKRSPFLSHEENQRAQIAAKMGHTEAWVQGF